jgi:hypothetical protein
MNNGADHRGHVFSYKDGDYTTKFSEKSYPESVKHIQVTLTDGAGNQLTDVPEFSFLLEIVHKDGA